MKAIVTKKQFQDLHEMFNPCDPTDVLFKKYLPSSDEPEYLIVFQCFMTLLHAQNSVQRIKVLEFIKKNVEIIG